MPDPVRFDLAAYCSDPSYPAQLEVGLYSNDLDLAAGVRLDQIIEPQFAGYARKRGDIWTVRRPVQSGGAILRSATLTFVCRETSTGAYARGAFVAAIMAGGPQLAGITAFRNVQMLAAVGRAISINVTLAVLLTTTPARS